MEEDRFGEWSVGDNWRIKGLERVTSHLSFWRIIDEDIYGSLKCIKTAIIVENSEEELRMVWAITISEGWIFMESPFVHLIGAPSENNLDTVTSYFSNHSAGIHVETIA